MATEPSLQHEPQHSKPPVMTVREAAVILAVTSVLFVVVSLFTLRYDLEGGRSYGVQGVPPAVPWFLLLCLLLVSEGLRHINRRLALSGRQLLVIFGICALGIPITGFMGVRSLLPHLSIPIYYAEPENEFARIATHIPDWLMPKDPAVIVPAYEGSPDGSIMWGPWLGPLSLWGAFMLVLGLTTLCWLCLLRNYWNETEHLSYPMLEIPTRLVTTHSSGKNMLLGSKLMWIGFASAAIFHLSDIAHYFNPSIPTIPARTDLEPLLTEEPLRYLLPMRFYIAPLTIGAAYLVPQDILFSVWFIYLLYKVVAMIGGMMGLTTGWDFPYYQEQAVGGYIAYGLMLLYAGRTQIVKLLSQAVRGVKSDDAYPLSAQVAVFGTLLGSGLIVLWCIINQFALNVSMPYFFILLLYTLVQARIRAETGVPLGWDYPFGTQQSVFRMVLGTRGISALGGEQGLVLLSNYSWLARYNYLGETAAFETDNMTMWAKAGVGPRQSVGFIGFALVAGLVLGFGIHIYAYYHTGASLLQGGGLFGGANTQVARGEYINLSAALISPTPPDLTRTKYIVAGFIITPLLALLRHRFLSFPIHPLGFLMATCYGPSPFYWSTFMLAWLAKVVILWLGGARTYTRAVPFFLGLVLGSALTYDVIWMIVRALLPEGMVMDYI